MKIYRFIGNPSQYIWNIPLINGCIYDGKSCLDGFMTLDERLDMHKNEDPNHWILNDWKEVTICEK